MDVSTEMFRAFDIDLKTDESMKKHTSIGVGGKARYFIQVKSLFSLNFAVNTAKKNKIPYKILGNGSNILVSDKGFDGLIISTKNLSDVFFKKNHVKAMCGATLKSLSLFLERASLTGFESVSHIPATVGGAIVQNAGAFGASISDNLVCVQTLSKGKLKTFDKNECKFGYRTSRFKNGKDIIVSATFDFKKGNAIDIAIKNKRYMDMRKEKFPVGKNCGSVFKNPDGEFAGRLIEKAGLKGYTVGGASVSFKHANFIECGANATATDVYRLIDYIKKKVNDLFKVSLIEEVEYVGEF